MGDEYFKDFIEQSGGWENFEIVLLEDYPCRSMRQLKARVIWNWLDPNDLPQLNDEIKVQNALRKMGRPSTRFHFI